MTLFQKLFPNKSAEPQEATPGLVSPKKPSKAPLIALIVMGVSLLATGAFAYKQSLDIQKLKNEFSSKSQEATQLQEKLSQLESDVSKTNSANDVLKNGNNDLQNVAQALALQLAAKPSSKTVFKE